MCLYLKKKQRPSDLFKNGQTKRIFWKKFHSRDLFSPFRGKKYYVGQNHSDRDRKERYEYENNTIDNGIHVYTKNIGYGYTLPVLCYKKDLVGIGKNDEAVFMKVTVQKRDLERFNKRYRTNHPT